ncbi:MAG: DNA alkylation repair protein [bacterium]|nr:DNA alkylation repair protein [bacterium]
MNREEEHDQLLRRLKKEGRDQGNFPVASYLGTMHSVYNVPVPVLRRIAREWVDAHKEITQEDYISFVNVLFFGRSREEKKMASLILERFPRYLEKLNSASIDRWMGELTGWEEVDSFCDEVDAWLRADLANRVQILRKWNKDRQIEKRRASLVVLCTSVRRDDSAMLLTLSFSAIDALKSEKHVMITKAISWLLRSLIKYHKKEVVTYLKANFDSLPAIATRETRRKLETGKK